MFEVLRLYLATVLLFLAVQVATVGIARLLKIRTPGMLGVCISVIGVIICEGIIPAAGRGVWSEQIFAFSMTGKALQIVGACVLVWSWTRDRCHNWVWLTMLGVACGGTALLYWAGRI